MNYVDLISIGIFLKVVAAQDEISPTGDTSTTSSSIGTGDEIDNSEFINNFDEVGYNTACEWMRLTDPTKFTLNLSREISLEDVTKLTFLNKGKRLHETVLEFPEDIGWKRELVNQIWSLYKAACPKIFVNESYINIMRELAMVYLNSVEPRASPDAEVWTAILKSLKECENKRFPPYNFTSAGLMIDQLILDASQTSGRAEYNDDVIEIGHDEGVKKDERLADIRPQVENAELVYDLDLIIDNLWQIFSHAFARCLRTAPSRELWGPRFKQLFFRDILEPLEERWVNPGKRMRSFLNLIVGDHDVYRNQMNILYCTQAAYFNPSGTLLVSQLVRPIKLTDIESGVSKFQNTRV